MAEILISKAKKFILDLGNEQLFDSQTSDELSHTAMPIQEWKLLWIIQAPLRIRENVSSKTSFI